MTTRRASATAGLEGVGEVFRVAFFCFESKLGRRTEERNVGGIGSYAWFPQAKANGMDTGLFVGFGLPLGFEIRVGMDYRRYWFDLNPVPPNPPYVAGGALDQYLAGTVGIAWRR